MLERIHSVETTFVDEEGDVVLPGWYFWDETDAYRHGPFETHEECQQALDQYARTL